MRISVVQKHIADQRLCFISPQNSTNPFMHFQGSIHHLCLYSTVCVNVGFANDEGDIFGYVTTKPELSSYWGMQDTTLTQITCRKQCFVYLLFYLYGIGKL